MKSVRLIAFLVIPLLAIGLVGCGSGGGGSSGGAAEVMFPLGLMGTDAEALPPNNNQNPTLPQTPVEDNPLPQEVSLPADFGSTGAEAFLTTPDQDVGLYQSLTIQFSQSMNMTAVEDNFVLKDSYEVPPVVGFDHGQGL